MKIAISAGHGKYIRGARGNPVPPYLDEVDEARNVVNAVVPILQSMGVGVEYYFDDVSRTQNENLKRIVDWHNARTRDLDVSVHFNSSDPQTSNPIGTEVYYYSQAELASAVSAAMAEAGQLKDRGGKQNTGLYFLRNTAAPSLLLEVCFVSSSGDANLYRKNFSAIANAIAQSIAGQSVTPVPPEPPDEALFQAAGRCSWFGGPSDTGVAPDEGLAFIYEYEQAPHLFLPQQPPGTTGLARRLDPDVFYVACRWDYGTTSKEMLADPELRALVRAGDKELLAWPADWGPHQDTGRVADLSPGLMAALGLETDDSVEVIYPATAQPQPEPEERARVDITATGPVDIWINGTKVIL